MNPEIRKKVLERDNYECQLSKLFGISHLSDVKCIERLEVHHKTYERYNQEDEEDLISVCRRCHDFLTSYIRALRFTHLNVLDLEDTNEIIKSGIRQKEKKNEDINIQDSRDITHDIPQRSTSRSTLRVD